MNCPKYVRNLLYKRAKAAATFLDCDCQIVEWLEKNKLMSEVKDYDILTGCESICNPFASSDRIIDVIEGNKNE